MKNMTLEDKPTTFNIKGAVRGSAAIRSFFGVEKKDEEEEDMTRKRETQSGSACKDKRARPRKT